MKSTFFLASMVFFLSTSAIAADVNPTETLLPETFTVYTDGVSVINQPQPGFTETALPTINLYKGTPGCYIACYSHQRANSAYSLDNFYMMGQVRVAGKYAGRMCEPTNFAGKDISGNEVFKTICSEKIEGCKGAHCWAGGDTGGWFGIQ
jgi:hypothetical protein